MPNVKIERARIPWLMGRKYEFKELEDLGFEFGIEIEEDEEKDNNGKVVKEFYKFDCMNNRPDLLAEASLVRAFKIYLSEVPTPKVDLTEATTSIIVDPSVQQIRPFIAAAILRNIEFNPLTYKAFIAAQEKLHDTFCRARKYASIGTHNLDSISGPFRYVAIPPRDFSFVPLSQEKKVDGLGMMELLETHKLKEYLHLIRDSPVYPVVLDNNGVVCSVPPIINGQHSKITIDTKNVLIEVTALSRPKANICLNSIIWAFAEYCSPAFSVEPVNIVYGEKNTVVTPYVKPKEFELQHPHIETLIGAPIAPEAVVANLARTGLTATPGDNGKYKVEVPFWRGDVLHECDILEDVAICYGYTKIQPALPPCATIGSRLLSNKFTDLQRHELAQAQFNEVLNFALCSRADLTTNLRNPDDSQLITIANAKTKEFQTGRTSLLPGLLKTVVENKAQPLPYKIFEAGDCIVVDNTTDTGSRNLRRLAALITDEVKEGAKKGLFSIVHGAFDILMKKNGLTFGEDYSLVASKLPHLFPGQQFEILLRGQRLGAMGVVHPQVLASFGWAHPVAAWELDLSLLQRHSTACPKQ